MDPLVSVFIPTKNSARYLSEILTAVRTQKVNFAYEIVIIDSGSTDATLEIARSFPDVRIYTILPADFGHGRTRNYAMTLCHGRYTAFLTHDATPATPSWLATLVRDVESGERVAGGYGRHIPRPDCDPFEARVIDGHFNIWHRGGRRVQKMDPGRRYTEEEFKELIFFSNANSIIKRSAWVDMPFRDVRMAEDQQWAMDVLAKGYRTIYSHDAVVFHSHSERALVKLQRSFDEFKALKALGAYARMRHPCYMLVSIVYFTLLDLYYLWHPRRNLSLGARLRWTPFAVTRNVARKVGEYLGSRHERIPVGVQRWLSFQEKLGSG